MSLFDIKEKDINAIDENLTWYDRLKLNKRYRQLAQASKNSAVDNKQDELVYEREKLHRQQKLDRLADKEKEVAKELEVEKRQARLDRLLHLKKTGENLNLLAKCFTAVSAITSMIGLASMITGLDYQTLITSWRHWDNLQYLFIGALFFAGELYCGWLFGQTDTITEFFTTDDKVSKGISKGKMALISLVYSTSIWSNGVFWWTLTHSILVTIVYSCLFDLCGLISCYYGFKYSNLDSPKIQSEDKETTEDNKNITSNQETKFGVTTDGQEGYIKPNLDKTPKIRKEYTKKLPKNYLKHKNTLSKLEDNARVNKDTFDLNTYDWKILRTQLEKDDLVYCKNKATYKKQQKALLEVLN